MMCLTSICYKKDEINLLHKKTITSMANNIIAWKEHEKEYSK